MEFHEKIYYCRKKSGLSQEALAEKIGVSRQAVSKWETGEAVPELSKLPLLSKVFGVSADWLLSEEEPVKENPTTSAPADRISKFDNLTDRIIDFAEKFFKKYIWVSGILISLLGAYRVISIILPVFSMSAFIPDNFLFLSLFHALIGFIMVAGGIVLTVVLKKWCNKNK